MVGIEGSVIYGDWAFFMYNNNVSNIMSFGDAMTYDEDFSIARELLKEATKLKSEKKYNEACGKLVEAYAAPDAEDLSIEDRLRLPMYLQLACRADEGWGILNELSIKYLDVFSQSIIANQMRIFLQKEKKYKQAILFSVWSICKDIERDGCNIEFSVDEADKSAALAAHGPAIFRSKQKLKVYGYTPKGNPITDETYITFKKQTEYYLSVKGLKEILVGDLKKAKLENKLTELCKAVAGYLSSGKYKLSEVRDLIGPILQ